MQKMNAISDWIKSNPAIAVASALTTILALFISIANAVPLALRALDVPECWTYANVYKGPWSEFRQEGPIWREYFHADSTFKYEFKEVARTRESIELLNLTERPEEAAWRTLMVRIPVCGGAVQLSRRIPQDWVYLCDVARR